MNIFIAYAQYVPLNKDCVRIEFHSMPSYDYIYWNRELKTPLSPSKESNANRIKKMIESDVVCVDLITDYTKSSAKKGLYYWEHIFIYNKLY